MLFNAPFFIPWRRFVLSNGAEASGFVKLFKIAKWMIPAGSVVANIVASVGMFFLMGSATSESSANDTL